MRDRLCIAAAAMSSSRATARGRRPWRRGFCDRPWPPDGNGGAFVSGDAHLRTVSEENHGRRFGGRGGAGVPGVVRGPPPDPGFWSPQPPLDLRYPPPPPGPRPQPFPFHRPPVHRSSWRPPPPGFGPQYPRVRGPPPPHQDSWQQPSPGFSSQHTPAYGPPGNSWQPLPSDFHPHQPRPRPQPADYRSWVPSSMPQPPPECERFRLLSYNILADYLAREHQSKLYFHIPSGLLDWDWRKRRLLIEFGLWSPDIMCLQEVDRFQDLEDELARYGYNGVWKMRTGNAVDGCAIFWRIHRFVLRHEEHIEFAKLGLRDNVAQICVLEVRTLLDRAYAISKIWNDAPVIICGDFNCTPKSPLYNFISEQKLSVSGLARNQVSGQYSACIYAPRPSTASGLYRAHPPHGNNDGKAAPGELDSQQTGVKDCHNTQNNVENAPSVDNFSSGHALGRLCSYSELENENRTKPDTLVEGVETDKLDSLPMCKEKDSSKETVDDIIEPSEFMESKGVVNLTSTHASSQEEDLHALVELQHDDKYVEDSSFNMGILNKQDYHVNSEHLVSPGGKETLHCALDSTSGVKSTSTIHNSCTFSTMQEDFIDLENTFSSCDNKPPFEDNKYGSPSNGSENSLYPKLESDKFPDDISLESLDISSSQRMSKTFAVSIATPLPEFIEPSAGLLFGQDKIDPDVSCLSSFKNKPFSLSNLVDSELDFESVDSAEKEVTGKLQNAIFVSEHVVADAHEKSPGATEDVASQNIICDQCSIRYSGNADLSSGVNVIDMGNSGNSSIDTGEITSKSHSSVIDDEEVSSDSTFLEELHGTGNADVTSFSRQSISSSFPDLFEGQSAGVGEVESDMLDSNTLHQPSKLQEKFYDPLLWTPMEIEAASGNAECTLLEHNLKLKSAYTEVEDYAGTKDSSREPQVTSYNRQFMGTVDYIWHSEGLQAVQVLDTIPKHVLRRTNGFPTKKWGSDHLALACEFAFTKA